MHPVQPKSTRIILTTFVLEIFSVFEKKAKNSFDTVILSLTNTKTSNFLEAIRNRFKRMSDEEKCRLCWGRNRPKVVATIAKLKFKF